MPNEVLEQLLELVPDATIAVRRDGTIVRVNGQAETLFGYEPGELIGEALERLVPDRFAAGHAAKRTGYFTETRARQMGSGLELYAKRKDGSEFPVDISLSQIELDGVVLATAAVRDISERLRADRRREQLELDLEREKAAREKQTLEAELGQLRRAESLGQLAGGIAHDFNNLLGVILNYSQLAVDALDSEDERTGRRRADRARRRAGLGADPPAPDLQPRRGSAPRGASTWPRFCAGPTRCCSRVLGGRAVLEARIDDELWPIEADPAQLEQVIVNLAVNARDAMPDGGRLVIDARNIALDDTALAGRGELAPGPYMRITVADTGTGMSAEVIRARVRAVLHDQAARRRDRARTLDRLRHRDQARRGDPDLLRAGIRHHGEGRPARDHPADEDERPGGRHRTGTAPDASACCWWRTRMRCGG